MAPATDNLLPQHDAALRDREAQLGHALETAYAPAARVLQAHLDSFLSAMLAIRIPALANQVDVQLTTFARIADTLIEDAQRDAAQLGSDHALALITAGVQPPAGVTVSWNRLPTEAIEQLVSRAYDGSPLSSLLDQIGPEAAAIVRQALLTGLAAGAGPRQIARIFQDAVDGGYKRALLIAKTETLNAYRSAALENYRANDDVVDEWEWSADSAACDICLAKDGTRYPLTAAFDEHPGGRCAPIPVTKSWADLGIDMSAAADEATWELSEQAAWDVVTFDYTTQERDERGRWAAGAGSAKRQALKAAHQAERASLRASHASARSDLRATHARQRAATARGQRGSLNEAQKAERASLRAAHASERHQLSETHAKERADLERGASGRLGSVSQAYGTDPNSSYQMQHRLVDLSEIHASNTASGGINPDYDPRLQPRDRSRSASQAQIDEVARKMNPDVLLTDFHAIDRGTPIIDEHGNVLSGNGRTLALAHAAERYPENYDQYKARLRAQAESLGLDPAAVDRMDRPMLVRELQGAADPVAFAREANSSGTLRMSPLEQAKVDAQILQDRSVLKLNVDEGQNIDQALRARDNRPFVDDFLASVPENERAYLLTRDGQLNQMGLYRAKAAVYTRVFEGEAGNRMAESMLESLDPELKNVQTGISQSLPQIARAKALIGSGARASDLDITEDSAKAIDALARIKDNTSLTANTPAHLVVDKYLGQAQMFGRELTPNQEVLLKHFDSISRKPAEIKDFFSRYAQLVEHSPAVGQSDLFGPSHALSRSELIAQLVGRVSAPAQAQIGMFSRMRAMFASIAGGLPPVRKRSDYTDITPDDLVWSLFYDRIAGNPDALTVGAPAANFTYEVPAMPPTTPTDPIAPVTRRGPIFKLGAYPDKQFSLSADEARRAVASFTPVAIDSEHKQSIFDGKLGQLKGVTLDGDVLYGEMDVPQWLHDLFPEQPIPVSTTWHRQQKQIIGLALAANPRVSDAAMMTAFSATFARHDTFEGQQAMQELHDHAARNGASATVRPRCTARTRSVRCRKCMTRRSRTARAVTVWPRCRPTQRSTP
jgi:SPP1 gp7 family putative phage head morphogenesis protein